MLCACHPPAISGSSGARKQAGGAAQAALYCAVLALSYRHGVVWAKLCSRIAALGARLRALGGALERPTLFQPPRAREVFFWGGVRVWRLAQFFG